MPEKPLRPFVRSFAAAAVVLALVACADEPLGSPSSDASTDPQPAVLPENAALNMALAELRRVTAAYHDVAAAVADGFVEVVACEERPGEGPVGTIYGHIPRLLDGVIDPSQPEALLYEPRSNGQLRLVGVELAIPYPLWTAPDPPEFFGVPFQREDELGVFGLHIWVWRHNPEGMFAEANPLVSCDGDA